MYDLFQTVLLLSLLGSLLAVLLLCLKPLMTRMVPPRWQTWLWALALLAMVLPVYRWVPVSPPDIDPVLYTQAEQTTTPVQTVTTEPEANQETTPSPLPQETPEPHPQRLSLEPFFWVWCLGTGTFLLVTLGSYGRFLWMKKRTTTPIPHHPLLEELKEELGIRGHVRLRLSPDPQTPMLAGVLFPVIYLPCRELSQDQLRMVLLHELTHYKRKDLLLKWLALGVNAVHWFNPLAWLLRANLSDACETACDLAVTRSMSTQERKQYMTTILTLAQE